MNTVRTNCYHANKQDYIGVSKLAHDGCLRHKVFCVLNSRTLLLDTKKGHIFLPDSHYENLLHLNISRKNFDYRSIGMIRIILSDCVSFS